jgi:hypothetical protein
MKTAKFRELALGLEGVTERPHFDLIAFRTPRKTFMTLGPSGADANLMLEPDHQALLVAQRPEVFEAIEGGWGRMGWTRMWIGKATEEEARNVVVVAWGLAQPVAKKKGVVRKKAVAKKKVVAKKKTTGRG